MGLKQVIVVRKDLGMRCGKMIAQGAHAVEEALLHADEKLISRWREDGRAKIAVRVESEEELFQIYEEARRRGLNVSLVKDSGRTEFKGRITATALCIGPDEEHKIDPVTQHLKLL